MSKFVVLDLIGNELKEGQAVRVEVPDRFVLGKIAAIQPPSELVKPNQAMPQGYKEPGLVVIDCQIMVTVVGLSRIERVLRVVEPQPNQEPTLH